MQKTRIQTWVVLLACLLILLGGRVQGQSIVFDLNADSIAQADGTAVTAWGTAPYQFAQATGANQPTYKTNIVNGHSVVRMGGSKYLVGPVSDGGSLDAINSNTSGWTGFAVFNNTAMVGYQSFLSKGNNTNTTATVLLNLYGQMPVIPPNVIGGTLIAPNTWHIVTYSIAPAVSGACISSVYLDGELLNRVNVVARTPDNTTAWMIGTTNGGPSFSNVIGDIARLQLYSGAMTDAQVRTQAAALATVYGITLPTFQANVNIVCAGTSLVQGSLTVQNNPSYTYHLQQFLGNRIKVHNFGLGGSTIAYVSSMASQINAMLVPGATNILMLDTGTNDLANAAAGAGATALTAYTSLTDAFRSAGWKVCVVSQPPRLAANGGGLASSTFETNRGVLNTGYAALPSGGHADAYVNLLANPALGTINDSTGGYATWTFGSGQSENGVTYGPFSIDGTHYSRIGNRTVAVEILSTLLQKGWLTISGTKRKVQ